MHLIVFIIVVSYGSFRGMLRPLKCLSNDMIASVFAERAVEYWMASSMSRSCFVAISTAFTSSAIVVEYRCSPL